MPRVFVWIRPDGAALRFVYDDALRDLLALGESRIRRASHVEPTRDGLWILDQGDNKAYLVAYKDGKVLRALETESKAGSGITFDGEAIWLASTYSREIIRSDARTGKTLAKYDSPDAGPVAWTKSRSSPLAKPPAAPASAPRSSSAAY